jgi:hypothetical protein
MKLLTFAITSIIASVRANTDGMDVVAAKDTKGTWQEFAVFPGISDEDRHPIIYVAQFNQTSPLQPIQLQQLSGDKVVPLHERAKFLENSDPVSTSVCPNTGRFLTSFTDAYANKVRTCVWKSTKISPMGSGTEAPQAGGIIVDRCADDGISMQVGSHYSHAACAGSDWLVVYSVGQKTDGYPIQTGLDVAATIMPLTDAAVDDISPPLNLTKSVANERNWAPIVAGSGFTDGSKRAIDSNYLVGWMHDDATVADKTNISIRGSIMDTSGEVASYANNVPLTNGVSVEPYTHQVTYLPRFEKYAVTVATTDGNGYLSLVDPATGKSTGGPLPAAPFASGDVVRVSQDCLSPSVNYDLIAYPTLPTGAVLVRVNADGTTVLVKKLTGTPTGYNWGYLGVNGFTECANSSTVLTMMALEDASKQTTEGNRPGTVTAVQPVVFDLGKLEGATVTTGASSATTGASRTSGAVVTTTNQPSSANALKGLTGLALFIALL